jgi:hypothetical protein
MVIVTSIHDPSALADTCRQCRVPAPRQGSVRLGQREVFGWIVSLPGVEFPIVCDPLTGLISYHPRDNAFLPYHCIMRFIHRFYVVRHAMHATRQGNYHFPRKRRRRVSAIAV